MVQYHYIGGWALQIYSNYNARGHELYMVYIAYGIRMCVFDFERVVSE